MRNILIILLLFITSLVKAQSYDCIVWTDSIYIFNIEHQIYNRVVIDTINTKNFADIYKSQATDAYGAKYYVYAFRTLSESPFDVSITLDVYEEKMFSDWAKYYLKYEDIIRDCGFLGARDLCDFNNIKWKLITR